MHSPPERDPNPPDDVVTDLECPECDHEMEPIGNGEWECEYPFCDMNSRDPEKAYENQGDALYKANGKLNGILRFLYKLVKQIELEKIHGSPTFDDLVAHARTLSEKHGGR